jgi:hypothetical protein
LCSFAADSYKLIPCTSIPGSDIDCQYKDEEGKYQPFCKVCTEPTINGGVEAVAASCSANPNCTSFVMESQDCGYLKSADQPLEYTDSSDVYKKL